MSTEGPREPDDESSRWKPSLASTPDEPSRDRYLPFANWMPVIAGALAGVLLRFVFFGEPGEAFSAMLGAFIYLAPVLVSAVTVYVAERMEPRSWFYYASAGFLANVLFILGTMLVLIEGLICAIVIAPLFGAIGALAGLLMGAVCRFTGWPGRTLSIAAVLPLVLGAIEPSLPIEQRSRTVERTVIIRAPTSRVWHSIQHASEIRPEEVRRGWIYRIGVPLPKSGVTDQAPEGRVRRISMGKSVHFDQVVTEWKPERLMRVRYRYQPDSFPAGALDEHVMLGGRYFDVEETDYELEPQGDATQMTIRIRYRVSTAFNWYADLFARKLFADFEEVILEFYRRRSEASGSAT
jgi:hypothetical protein